MIARRKGSQVWWLDIWVGGKRIRRSLRTTERPLAIERARDITMELRAPRPAGVQIVGFFEKYSSWALETKPASYKTEKYRLTWIADYLRRAGIAALEGITPHVIEQMRAEVRAQDRRAKSPRPASAGTANRYCALLRTVINKAKDWGDFKGDNPVSRVKFYREGGKIRPLSEDEIRHVLEAAETISLDKYAYPTSQAIYDICRVVLNTGLRRSEALRLRWSDIIDDELRIRGKGGKVRMIPINAETASILQRRPRLTQFVFDLPNRDSQSVLRRVTETISRNAKVSFHLHLLRHAFASRLLAAGIDIVTIGDLLGHSSSMVSLLYAHSSKTLKKAAIFALAGRTEKPNPTDAEEKKDAPARNGAA